MKHYLDFIQSKNLQNNEIFSFLKCDENEGKILQFMAKALLEGEMDFVVHILLAKVFPHKDTSSTQGEHSLAFLHHIRNLIELGWITQSSFLQPKLTDIALLELYNDNICLSDRNLVHMADNQSAYLTKRKYSSFKEAYLLYLESTR